MSEAPLKRLVYTIPECIELLGEEKQSSKQFLENHPDLPVWKMTKRNYRVLVKDMDAYLKNKKIVPISSLSAQKTTDDNRSSALAERENALKRKENELEKREAELAVRLANAKSLERAVTDDTANTTTMHASVSKALFCSITECIQLLNEPHQTVYEFCKNHPTLKPIHVAKKRVLIPRSQVEELIKQRQDTIITPVQKDRRFKITITPSRVEKALIRKGVKTKLNHDDYGTIHSFVYMITDGEYVKIGKADDVVKRMKALQTSHPTKLRILFTIPVYNDYIQTAEVTMHEIFNHYRMDGEWFDILDKIDLPAFKRYFGSLTSADLASSRTYEEIIKYRSRKDPFYEADLTPTDIKNMLLRRNAKLAFKSIGGILYFISDTKYVKIGLTGDVESRMKELQSGTPRPLELLFTIPMENYSRRTKIKGQDIDSAAERALHDYFAEFRMEGEWFDILDKINTKMFRRAFGQTTNSSEESLKEFKQRVIKYVY